VTPRARKISVDRGHGVYLADGTRPTRRGGPPCDGRKTALEPRLLHFPVHVEEIAPWPFWFSNLDLIEPNKRPINSDFANQNGPQKTSLEADSIRTARLAPLMDSEVGTAAKAKAIF